MNGWMDGWIMRVKLELKTGTLEFGMMGSFIFASELNQIGGERECESVEEARG